MADQHNDNIPVASNNILADVADLKENSEFHKDCFEAICDEWSNTATTNLIPKIAKLYQLSHLFSRPLFTYNGGVTPYTYLVGPGSFWCKDKYCFWDSELTTGAVGTPAADTMYYLYLDYSAITSKTEITNSEMIWSSTAPTWNDTYKAQMNGDDRCIFSVRSNDTPDDLLEVYHDGSDYVEYATSILNMDSVDIDTVYTAQALTSPAFGDNAKVRISLYAYAASVAVHWLYYRKGGTSVTGNKILRASSNVQHNSMVLDVRVDASQEIEVKYDLGGNNEIYIRTMGYYLPRGM